MLNTGKLAGRTVFITGASRGIGKAIALKVAKDGANVVIAAKTAEAHPKLPGTIYSAAKEVEAAGGKCLPCIVDIRHEDQIQSAVEKAVKQFGGIDILVNNASAISLTGTLDTDMKRYDLMHGINTRGTFLTSKLCLPYLKKGTNPHILNLSPPLNMNPHWFKDQVAYTMAKYGMSMCVLGMAEEFKQYNIAVNAIWPRTAILTAAMEMIGGGAVNDQCRKPEIIADAAYVILTRDSRNYTGNFAIDDLILKEAGITDLEQYAVKPGTPLLPDFFLDDDSMALRNISPTSNPSASSGHPEVDAVFKAVKGAVNADAVKSTSAVFLFTITSDKGEVKYYIDLKNGDGSVGSGDPTTKADVSITMNAKDIVALFSGTLKPMSAFMSGKLKMKGDMGKAMKLEPLLSRLKAKL